MEFAAFSLPGLSLSAPALLEDDSAVALDLLSLAAPPPEAFFFAIEGMDWRTDTESGAGRGGACGVVRSLRHSGAVDTGHA